MDKDSSTIEWYKFPVKFRPSIKMVTQAYGWDSGDTYKVRLETKDDLYFNDIYNRWTVIEKNAPDFVFLKIASKSLQDGKWYLKDASTNINSHDSKICEITNKSLVRQLENFREKNL